MGVRMKKALLKYALMFVVVFGVLMPLGIWMQQFEKPAAAQSSNGNRSGGAVVNGTTSQVAANGIFSFSNTNNQASAPADTGISRVTGGIVAVGNGTQGDSTGWLRFGNGALGSPALGFTSGSGFYSAGSNEISFSIFSNATRFEVASSVANQVDLNALSGPLRLYGNGNSSQIIARSPLQLGDGTTGGTLVTNPNCQLGGATGTASPAACGAASVGMIAVPASQTTYTVNTTAVTANSEIFVQQMSDNSGLPSSPTCSASATVPINSSRTAATSFTITQTSVAAVTCFHYMIVN